MFSKGYNYLEDARTIAARISRDGKLLFHPDAKDRKSKDETADALWMAEDLVLRAGLIIDLFDDISSATSYRRALFSLKEIDAKSCFSSWKALYSGLIEEDFLLSRNWQIFKQSVSTLPKWMVAPLFRYLKDKEDVSLQDFQKALQWARFDSKLSFLSVSNYEEAVEYLNDEFVMSTEPVNEELCENLHSILVEWLEDFPDESFPFTGRHSGGAVNGLPRRQATARRKTGLLRKDEKTETYLRLRAWDGSNVFSSLTVDDGELKFTDFDRLEESAEISVVFVPKDPVKRRVVSPEDATNMFLQGDAAELIAQWLNKKHWCNLTDQQTSRDMAVEGSRTGLYTTMDASKASDFVRHAHLRIILRDTQLEPLYWLTRTDVAYVPEPDPRTGEVTDSEIPIKLQKAAPMGSKICFLMETLVFALLCEYAVRKILGRRSRKGDFRVYGDDTIILTSCYWYLRLLMSFMRYRVNDTKSFSSSSGIIFREACGIFAVNGIDVTPFMWSRRFRGVFAVGNSEGFCKPVKMVVPDPALACGLVDAMNRLTVYGLATVRKWMYTALREREWLKSIWRVTVSDYEEDIHRIREGKVPLREYPTPYLLTYDFVDANWNIPITTSVKSPLRGSGVRCQVYKPHRLEISARATDRSNLDSIDYFHWSTQRSIDQLHCDDSHPIVHATERERRERFSLTAEGMDNPMPSSFAYRRPGFLTWRKR